MLNRLTNKPINWTLVIECLSAQAQPWVFPSKHLMDRWYHRQKLDAPTYISLLASLTGKWGSVISLLAHSRTGFSLIHCLAASLSGYLSSSMSIQKKYLLLGQGAKWRGNLLTCKTRLLPHKSLLIFFFFLSFFKKMSSVMNSALLSYLLFTCSKDSMYGRLVMMFELRLDLLAPAGLLPEAHALCPGNSMNLAMRHLF